MKKSVLVFLVLGINLIAADGRGLSAKCAACHGANFEKAALGKSAVVAGQSANQIELSLREYKAGTRNTAGMGMLMRGQVASFSDYEIRTIAEYIASNASSYRGTAVVNPSSNWSSVLDQNIKACDNGDVNKCLNLANTYYFGNGVEPNREKAKELYKKACDKGNAEGCNAYSNLNGNR